MGETLASVTVLTRADIEQKFRGNVAYGGWSAGRVDEFLRFAGGAFDGPLDLTAFRG